MFCYVFSGLTGLLLIQQTVTRNITWPLIVVIKTKRAGRYRSFADNLVELLCYFNEPNDDENYNIFTSKQIKEEGYNGIYFKIEKVRGTTQIDKTLMLKIH